MAGTNDDQPKDGQLSLQLPDHVEEAASTPRLSAQVQQFGSYIVYVDESGDHGLASVDAQYPVFVLSFCVFHKGHYTEKVVTAIERFKFRHFGHDSIVLHEHEIRK